MSTSLILLFATSRMLGFRHGIDWDHIAAIADIVGGQPRPGLAIRYGSMYALGHSVIIFGVGLVAIVLGLLICNSGMSLLVSLGFGQARHRVTFSLALGVLTGVFSSVVGVLFLLGKSALLPALLGD